jgi:transcriptional antiterminator RfaH
MPTGAQEDTSAEPICWACAGLRPNAYRIAQRNLLRQGYRTFVPMMRETRRQSKRFVEVIAPVFPGYIFIGLARDQRWTPINNTLGVTRLVSFCGDGRPAPLPADLMADLLQSCDEEGRIAAPPSIAIASEARLARGPLQGIAGKVTRLKSGERVELLMTLFQREITVTTVKQNIVSAASQSKARLDGIAVPY